ncbi:general secretion pathway protein GspB [Undibacterium arcticum]|uniref:General secretion pathway protein GspB n=1 Tax=Undibacterium arcticum TaxID=1762892 RepID=A0ABV7F5I4_9BURK
MSYILDALKKAEAERNLGSIPDLHAQTHAAPGVRSTGSPPWRSWIGVALTMTLILLAVAWFKPWQPSTAVVATAPLPQTPTGGPTATALPLATAAPEAVVVTPAKPDMPAGPASATATTAQAVTAMPAAKPTPTAPKAAAQLPKKSDDRKTSRDTAPADDGVLTQRELPQHIQSELPPVAVGGYIYSDNQADRQLLINKSLRREGDEVATGLVLEKMSPHSAILNYRGYRYRISY